ncbi:hypothetical protein CENSYa_2021 [Cenarchaeum symbiosum A]|uniref:Uncharacterized protein n=1 Tax=Cenarchaeum symbiosum (strain A) TaxID=414004 RepID=A0RZ58_CENSY|nr:hypothetical protein CENSYa_2021 [Cenarchaeum symbiosum A]
MGIYVIFAIVMVQGFLNLSEVLIPVDGIFDDESAITAASLFVSYVIIVSSWIGYSRSLSKRPYSDNWQGSARFVLDIMILFEYFYLLSISTTEYFTEQFPAVVFTIFVTYAVWDRIKRSEYKYLKKQDNDAYENMAIRSRKTIICLAVSFAILVYHSIITEYMIETYQMSESVGIAILLVLISALVIYYRAWKWNMRETRLGFLTR